MLYNQPAIRITGNKQAVLAFYADSIAGHLHMLQDGVSQYRAFPGLVFFSNNA